MRGAYYVAIALLVVDSSWIAADSDPTMRLQTSDHNVMSAGNFLIEMLPKRYLRERSGRHNNVATTAGGEERGHVPVRIGFGKNPVAKASKAVVWDGKWGILGLKSALMKASGKISTELQFEPPGDLAAIAEASHSRLSKNWLEMSSEDWGMLIDLQPVRSKLLHRALPPGKNGPMARNVLHGLDEKSFKAVHERFFQLCGLSSYDPTVDETSYFWSMRSWKLPRQARNSLKLKARNSVVTDLMTVMEIDSMWDLWVGLTIPQRIEILNDSLNAHYRRWKKMFKIFYEKWPFKIRVSPTKNLRGRRQPRLDKNIGLSEDLSASVHVESLSPPLAEPTSLELTTEDFLSTFSKIPQSSVNDKAGKSTDQAPSLLLTLGMPYSV